MIGVGLMGLGIASNVQSAGWALHFLDHPGNQPTADLVSGGAISHDTAQELTRACDTIILCVTGAPQVTNVMTSDSGVLAGMSAGKTVVDCSTSLPKTTETIAQLVRETGGRYIDAPMTRTPKEAAEGRLNLIVGGAAEDLAAQRPLLESFAENIAHAGDVGAGHAMKLLHNFVSLGFAAVLAEAAAVARKSGVEGAVFQDILAKGGGAGVVLDRMSPFITGDDCGGFRFTLSNSDKDIGYYREMAAQAGGAHGLADAVGTVFGDMVADGQGDKFMPELIALLQNK
ncbi:MAG: 2-hydroxy-3-oxopropionate reductase [Robiginitomaculum sp.]|nr:MAG: 2-hydroxy-3-oxopropionate reductase [Robiginitomaculum sp.]